MMSAMLHPNLDRLVRFADGELDRSTRERVASHLERCDRCRRELSFLRNLERAAGASPLEHPPAGVLERVLAARVAGQRVILPVPKSGAMWHGRGRYRIAAIAAAAALLFVIFTLAGPSSELEALVGESELSIEPHAPTAGARVAIAYGPLPSLFQRESRLVLRGRLRSAESESYDRDVSLVVLDTLRRDRGGVYRGDFVLPPGVVFVALAVEDPRAERVDARGGIGWHVLAHRPDGVPLADALHQQHQDYMGRSWEQANATARRMTELYPGSLRAWSTRAFLEGLLLGDANADSARKLYAPIMDSLVAEYRRADLIPGEEIGLIFSRTYMGEYLNSEHPDRDYWLERIRRERPRDYQVAQYTTLVLSRQYRDRPRELLEALEEAWPSFSPIEGSGDFVYNNAIWAARETNDSAAFLRWTDRWIQDDTTASRIRDRALMGYVPLRQEGMRRVRRHLQSLENPSTLPRLLEHGAADHARRVESERRRLLADLGRALLAEGRTSAALDTLALAVQTGWSVPLYRDVAAARLMAGDSAGAAVLYARIAADPRTSAAFSDSVSVLVQRALGTKAWVDSVAAARRLMFARTLVRAKLRAPRDSPLVSDALGAQVTLSDLTAGEPSVVIFWSRFCGPALEVLPELVRVASRLRAGGTSVVFLVDEAPNDEVRTYLANAGVTMPVHFDSRREAATAFVNFGTPAYYVLDQRGRIRYDRSEDEEELLLLVESLRNEGSVQLSAGGATTR